MKKSIMSVVLCIVLVAMSVSAVFATAVSAEDIYMTYTLETLELDAPLAANDEVALDVSVSASDDFNGANFRIAFDDALFTYVGYELNGAFAAIYSSTTKYVNVHADNAAVDGKKEIWVSVLGDRAYATAEDEIVMTITLKAKTDIDTDVEMLIVAPEVTSDASTLGNYELVADAVNGGIVFAVEDFVKGDTNGDGEVGLADAMQAFYHVNEKISLSPEAIARADVNGDGVLALADAMKIFYFVNEKIAAL